MIVPPEVNVAINTIRRQIEIHEPHCATHLSTLYNANCTCNQVQAAAAFEALLNFLLK